MGITQLKFDPLTLASFTLILILAGSTLSFGWTVDWTQIPMFYASLTLLLLTGAKIRTLTLSSPSLQKAVHSLGTCWCMFFLFSLLAATGAFTCSVLASFGLPYVDDYLHAADQAMGFDWVALLNLLLQYPSILMLLSHAYFSIGIQHVSIIILLSILRPDTFVFRFMLGWTLSLIITALLFPLFPAVAAFDYYQISPSSIPVSTASAGWNLTELLNSIRSGSDNVLNFGKLTGPVTMPSLHAAMSFLFAYSMWIVCGHFATFAGPH